MIEHKKIPIIIEKSELPYLTIFLNEHSKKGFRENNLNIILDIKEKITIYEIDMPLLGTTYQSKWREITDLRDVSHTISSIEIEDNNIYANISILKTPSGNSLGYISEKFILKPVYKGLGLILTFDLDFQQINNAA